MAMMERRLTRDPFSHLELNGFAPTGAAGLEMNRPGLTGGHLV